MAPKPQNNIEEGLARVESSAAALRTAYERHDVDGVLDLLRRTRELDAAATELAGSAVGVLRVADTSWLEISAALDVTRQAAWDRHRDAEARCGPAERTLASDLAGTAPAATLEVGRPYTRVELQRLFGIRDASIRNVVFEMKARKEIWLFVTERKQPDRVQFADELVGNTLRWQGQLSGRTDAKIINHRSDGRTLLLFYRTHKYEHPGAGFRLEGPFEYVSHHGAKPTSFVLQRAG